MKPFDIKIKLFQLVSFLLSTTAPRSDYEGIREEIISEFERLNISDKANKLQIDNSIEFLKKQEKEIELLKSENKLLKKQLEAKTKH